MRSPVFPSRRVPHKGDKACSSTLNKDQYTDFDLHLGKSLAKLEVALPNGQRQTVQAWLRDQRQSRFSAFEQDIINRLLRRTLYRYDVQVKSSIGKTEPDIKAMPQKIHVMHKGRRPTHEQNPKRAEAEEQLPAVRRTVVEELKRDASNHVLPTVREIYMAEDSPFIGSSYEGQGYQLKRKCPICEMIYVFKVAGADVCEEQEILYDHVGELDPFTRHTDRGCCAEAPCFISGLVGRQYDVRTELGPSLDLNCC